MYIQEKNSGESALFLKEVFGFRDCLALRPSNDERGFLDFWALPWFNPQPAPRHAKHGACFIREVVQNEFEHFSMI